MLTLNIVYSGCVKIITRRYCANIIPMSGQGRHFKVAGYKTPKYMLDCGNGLSVIENLVKTFPSVHNFYSF